MSDQSPEPEVEVADAELVEEEGVETVDAAEPAGEEPAGEEPDFKDLYYRAAAETDNVRKRARRDVEQATGRGMAKVLRELLPSLDNLELALQSAEAQEDEEHTLTKGIRLVQQEMLSALARVGVERFSPKGEPFDPHHHEAVSQMPVEGVDAGTVAEVFQSGYTLHGEVLRPAKVVVAA